MFFVLIGSTGKGRWISWKQLLDIKPIEVAREIASAGSLPMQLDETLRSDTKVLHYANHGSSYRNTCLLFQSPKITLVLSWGPSPESCKQLFLAELKNNWSRPRFSFQWIWNSIGLTKRMFGRRHTENLSNQQLKGRQQTQKWKSFPRPFQNQCRGRS